jgi:hypothetical protein
MVSVIMDDPCAAACPSGGDDDGDRSDKGAIGSGRGTGTEADP